jgi:uncharacterized protein (TIGR03790 family)
LNVVVVVNQNSTNSVQLGNYYCEQRSVPPQNVLRISWTGGNQDWTSSDFDTYLSNPLLAMLASRQLTNQIDFVVLSMDIPYRVTATDSAINSTTSTLFYGYKADPNPPCSLAAGSANLYAGSEGIFRSTPPISANSNSFLVTMITSSNLVMAKQIVDSGVLSDNTFPTQTVVLAKSSDIFRNVRYPLFDNAIFDTRLRGNYSMVRSNSDLNQGFGLNLGIEQGVVYSPVLPNTFVPGAMADNLTSYGGLILRDSGGQLTLLSYLAAGAAGSYGTVEEPCNYPQKFPSPLNYFLQARGFSLAECYYQSLANPYHGLLAGEPLAAPFARPASGAWNNLPPDALLSGATNLALQFAASDFSRPVQQVDLFLDGVWVQTLTNLPPARSNLITVAINGNPMSFSIPLGATIQSVASNLASLFNEPANTNLTRVSAFASGDRIELQSSDRSKTGNQLSVSITNSIGAGTSLTSFVTAGRTNFLDSIACGMRYFLFDSADTNQPPVGAWIMLSITKTNGTVVSLAVTNATLGTTVPQVLSSVIGQLNTNSQLIANDGCVAEDFVDYSSATGNPNDHHAEFNLRARSGGWAAAQLQAVFTSSSAFSFVPTGAQNLEDYLSDLQPRNHLYVTAGVTNLSFSFGFNSATQANGFHELTAVAYEGSHVRTQKRVPAAVRIQNGSLSATFTLLAGASNTVLEATLRFSVTANTNTISQIELFSTGGSLSNVLGQASAAFAVAGTNLGLGLHPFYALVTATDGKQYRTETKWIRLVNTPDLPFVVSITNPPPTLSWPATAGRSYDILSTTNLTNSFVLRGTLTPSNSPALWTETNLAAPQRFYRVRTSD